jgi:hypothetical protein
VIVNVTDDGTLNCVDFEDAPPMIALNGEFVASPYAICVANKETYVLSAAVDGAVSYRWLRDGFMEVSTTSSFPLTESGVYTVTAMSANGCKAVSEPLAVSMENAPVMPEIKGDRIATAGEWKEYEVTNIFTDVDYKWIRPSGYELGVGSFDTDTKIRVFIGKKSAVLRVIATNLNSSGACSGAEGRLGIEVRSSYSVDVFPTVASNGTPLRIVPKNMRVTNIAVINSVGESHAYKIISDTRFPAKSGTGIQIGSQQLEPSAEEIQIVVSGLSSGHYFIVCYGNATDGGRPVVYTAHVVIKN